MIRPKNPRFSLNKSEFSNIDTLEENDTKIYANKVIKYDSNDKKNQIVYKGEYNNFESNGKGSQEVIKNDVIIKSVSGDFKNNQVTKGMTFNIYNLNLIGYKIILNLPIEYCNFNRGINFSPKNILTNGINILSNLFNFSNKEKQD